MASAYACIVAVQLHVNAAAVCSREVVHKLLELGVGAVFRTFVAELYLYRVGFEAQAAGHIGVKTVFACPAPLTQGLDAVTDAHRDAHAVHAESGDGLLQWGSVAFFLHIYFVIIGHNAIFYNKVNNLCINIQ